MSFVFNHNCLIFMCDENDEIWKFAKCIESLMQHDFFKNKNQIEFVKWCDAMNSKIIQIQKNQKCFFKFIMFTMNSSYVLIFVNFSIFSLISKSTANLFIKKKNSNVFCNIKIVSFIWLFKKLILQFENSVQRCFIKILFWSWYSKKIMSNTIWNMFTKNSIWDWLLINVYCIW